MKHDYKKLFKNHASVLDYVFVFDHEDLEQEYELYKIEHNTKDCFDYFFSNLLRVGRERRTIQNSYYYEYDKELNEDFILFPERHGLQRTM